MQKQLTPKQKFVNNLTTFFQKYRVVLLVILGVVVVGLFAFGILEEIRKTRLETSVDALFDAENQYSQWQSLSDNEQKLSQIDGVLDSLEKVSNDFKKTYAGDRAQFLKAEAYFEVERYSDAVTEYLKLIESGRKSIVIPNAINNCAIAYEKLEEYQKAIDTYLLLVNDYPFESAITPHALLNAGYLYETIENTTEALAMYNKLIEDYPNSSWTNFARTSIIHLNSSN